MVEGITSRWTILMPCIRSGSKAGVKSCLSCPDLLSHPREHSVSSIVCWFSTSKYRRMKIKPKKSFIQGGSFAPAQGQGSIPSVKLTILKEQYPVAKDRKKWLRISLHVQ